MTDTQRITDEATAHGLTWDEWDDGTVTVYFITDDETGNVVVDDVLCETLKDLYDILG